MLTNEASEEAFHVHAGCVVTEIAPFAGDAEIDALVGESVNVHVAQALSEPQYCPPPHVPHARVPPHPSLIVPHVMPASHAVFGTQTVGQSLSFAPVHPDGQQPSPLAHVLIAAWEHCALQVLALPVTASAVQAWPSSQLVGHVPSQISGPFVTPSPQNVVAPLAPWHELEHTAQLWRPYAHASVIALPSSHDSPASTMPLPHCAGGGVTQVSALQTCPKAHVPQDTI